MYFKKSAKTSADNPFLSSDENDESTNEEEYDADNIYVTNYVMLTLAEIRLEHLYNGYNATFVKTGII